MTHKTQLHSKMLFSSQVGHCDGAMIRGPSGGPCSARQVPCQPPRWGGQHHMAVGEIRLLRVLLSIGAKNELSFCRKMGVEVFHFYLFYIKNSQRSAVCMDSDTLWTVQGILNIPVASWHSCCMCYCCCLGVQATVCQICSPIVVIIEAVTTGDFPFGLDSSTYSAILTCILMGLYVFL